MAKLENYPIPKAVDLFAILCCGEKFTKLEMSQAYQNSYWRMNKKKHHNQYTQRTFLVQSSASWTAFIPWTFQRTVENLLQGIALVVVRVDDILVTGSSDEEHLVWKKD